MRRSVQLLLVMLPLFAVLASGQVTPTTFEGIDASDYSGARLGVDPNGAVGTKQYMEWADSVYEVFDKSGNVVVPITAGQTPWQQNNMPDCYGTDGNVEILFDHLASRWVIGRRQGAGTYFYCIAISNTDDFTSPTFAWYTYELPLNAILGLDPSGKHTYYPDYPKIGTWADAYYVTVDLEDPDNGYQEAGVVACAFDRTDMLQGLTMLTPQCFEVKGTEPYLSHSLEPADIDGLNAPPTGQPEYFVSLQNPSAGHTTASFLNEWIFQVNWNNPSLSKFTGPTPFTVPSYTQGCYFPNNPENTICVPEPSTSVTKNFIDSVGDRVMQRFSYRRFLGTSGYQSWLISTADQVGSGAQTQTGVQWYEYRDKGSGHYGIVTFNDGNYRFMPSIAEDQTGHMAVGYSISGTTMHPSIAASYLNLNKVGPPTEIMLYPGAGDEENSYHWGVYTSMTVDPSDDCTFWYVNEYFGQNQIGSEVNWQTRISNFKLPTCP